MHTYFRKKWILTIFQKMMILIPPKFKKNDDFDSPEI